MAWTLNDCFSAVTAIKSILNQHSARMDKLEKSHLELAAKFAYYWYDDNKYCLAIVQRIYKKTIEGVDVSVADLYCLNDMVSGGTEVVKARQMVHPDKDWPKGNRWQPVVMPGTTHLLAEPDVEETTHEPAKVGAA